MRKVSKIFESCFSIVFIRNPKETLKTFKRNLMKLILVFFNVESPSWAAALPGERAYLYNFVPGVSFDIRNTSPTPHLHHCIIHSCTLRFVPKILKIYTASTSHTNGRNNASKLKFQNPGCSRHLSLD